MRHETDVLDEECWNLIWRAPIQQRIRAFLWLACHDRLLGNLNRYKRQLAEDAKCYLCGHNEESTLHILRDCPAARQVWRIVLTPSLFQNFFTTPLKEWLTHNLKDTGNTDDQGWPTLFGIVVWWIWRWRNCYVFDKGNEIPIDLGAFIRIRVDEAFRSLSKQDEHKLARPIKQQQHIGWQAPNYGWYVINCDGAAKGSPGPAGGGALIRDHEGNFISGLAANFGRCNSFRAEMLALTRGLELAKNLQIEKLEVQLDNLSCVQILKQGQVPRGECFHEITRCLNMLNDGNWEIKIAHIYREGNRAADWLANRGVLCDTDLEILNCIPAGLSSILEEDIRGLAFPRFIPP